MIKAPITKTGDIRYFEFIKIFVLVAFFVALITSFTESGSYTLHVNPIVGFMIFMILFSYMLIVSIYEDAKIVVCILKEVIITFIPVYFLDLVKTVNKAVVKLKTLFITDLSQANLCVVRC